MSGLIVPVDVLAYCIGTVDAQGPARRFAGATTDYANQTISKLPAFLGINVTRDFDQDPLWPMEAGVHLHWAMPDALTRALSSGDSMRFPSLPNRWLISRIVGNAQSSKHWIVESDTLSTAPPGGNAAPTVPVSNPAPPPGNTSQPGFRYLGAWQVFDNSWTEPTQSVAPHQTLKALTGYDLHAVATGDIAFAAFYPNARSIFGFHDDLSDLTTVPAELMYVVTGWYAPTANDPLSAGLNLTQLQTQLRWTFTSSAQSPVNYSLYSGLIQGIQWNPTTRYLSDSTVPIQGDVALGNHPAEALAAYFRGRNYPTVPAFEELLTLYLTGLLPSLATPSPGQLAALEETLHELQFTAVDAGTIYTVTREATEATSLPLPLADALNLLNQLQQAADVAASQKTQGQWQLFAAWYRLFQVDLSNQTAAFNAFSAQYNLQAALAQQATSTASAAASQLQAVQKMLSDDLSLTPVPAARYLAPTEPVVLLAGDAAAPAERYGGDGRYHSDAYLVCRLDSDVLQSVAIGTQCTLTAAQFAALPPSTPNPLPYAAVSALIEEAALLNIAVAATASGIPAAALSADLTSWLAGNAAQYYGKPSGVPPTPIEMNQWTGENPWCSLMLLWEAEFHPLLATRTPSGSVDYPPGFFTANYSLDPNNPRNLAYTPTSKGITIDPAKINFDADDPQSGTALYSGAAVLSATAADNLADQLAKYLAKTPDPTLQTIANQLAATDIVMQSLTGFNNALLTRAQSLQLSIGVSPTVPLPFRNATQQTASIIPSLSDIPPLAPQFNGAFNALRAGYMQLSLNVMDPFGRKRPVQIQNLYIADNLSTYVGAGTLEPGIVYAQPRLAQPSRLLFRWLAADTTEYDEMNVHPATTPVCGWLLPNHISVSFFIYDGQGNPLGNLALRADGSAVVWQATPGNQGTIDADLPTVMQNQNPHLRDLALALSKASPTWFRALWQAADTAVTQISPATPDSQSSMAVLAGRPLAVVQVSLLLARQGIAAFDQNLATMSGSSFTDTEHALNGVQFPVVIGDLQRLDDGLIGYFKQSNSTSYDFGTFYTEAAPQLDPGVAVPSTTNLLLTPFATPETAPTTAPVETKLLMLVDPRAPVHATMGILPTQTLAIPPEQYEDVLAGLELTYPANPLLRPTGGLAVPIPAIAGYNWSWIEERLMTPGSEWIVDAELQAPTANAVWQYSPQALTEGWLRLNPELLRFRLADQSGSPVVTAGTTTALTLSITNTRTVPVRFSPGKLVDEATPKQGSLFYIHFGSLVVQSQVAALSLSAPGWAFQCMNDAQYGSYWAASPAAAPATLEPGGELSVAIGNISIATNVKAQARVYFDYYNVVACDDGVDVVLLAVQPATATA